MAFTLEMYPINYIATFNPETKNWDEKWVEVDTITFSELQSMTEEKRREVYANRNQLGLQIVTHHLKIFQ